MVYGSWANTYKMSNQRYTCAYCDSLVAPSMGYLCERALGKPLGRIVICPNCNNPTYLKSDDVGGVIQYPHPSYKEKIDYLPIDIESIYNEIKICINNQAYTAVVLLSRKILMNVAVDSGAKEGKRFIEYVDYLEDIGTIPKDGRGWVDVIRKAGNTATHEIPSIDSKTAHDVLTFLEFLLRIKYEMPGKMAKDYNE